MPLIRITKTTIDRLEKPAKTTVYYDTELTGFFVRVQPSGAKTYGVAYRAGSGRTAPKRTVTIARAGKLTPDQAREQARQIIADAVKGQDPAAVKAAAKREMTVNALIDLYEKEGLVRQRGKRMGDPMKERSARYLMARLRHHVIPLLGSRKASQIGPGDVERFVLDVAAGKTASDQKVGPKRIIVSGGEGAARKVVRDFSAVCSFAERRGIIATNPVAKAAVRKVDNERERFLSLAEMVKFWEALDALESEGANPKAIRIIRLWALTGCRREEVEALKWVEVDLPGSYLHLEDTKEGRSDRPLAEEAVEVLKEITPVEGSPYVFPAERGERWFQGAYPYFEEARTQAGLDGDGVVVHTFRHTMGSMSASDGRLLLTGAVLGHKNPRSTARYAHVQKDPAREAADSAVGRFTAALARNKPKEGEDGAPEAIEQGEAA